MTYLTVENLSKHFGERTLFENITFGMSKGDKTALVAPNGTGKSTLLKIRAGEESQSGGEVMLQSDVRVGYLKHGAGTRSHYQRIYITGGFGKYPDRPGV